MTHGGSRRRRRKKMEMQTGFELDEVYGSVAGTADFLAGSTDETVGRLVDDIDDGDIALTDFPARLGDDLLGSTDEAFARQFDDEPGGGFIDGFLNTSPVISPIGSVGFLTGDNDITGGGSIGAGGGEPNYVQQASASLETVDRVVPPGGPGLHVVRVRNGVARIPPDSSDRRPTDAQDIINPEGAAIGVAGAGVAAAAAGASVGSVVGPLGAIAGGAAGVGGSIVGSRLEEAAGALGLNIVATIDQTVVASTTTSVGVPAGGIGKNGKSVQLQQNDAPDEEGEYTMKVVVSTWQTGTVIDTMETTVRVEEGEEAQTRDNGDNPNGGSGTPVLTWMKENPGISLIGGVGSLVAINSFTGEAGETIVQ